jgi:small redox-active disulfide protein 2
MKIEVLGVGCPKCKKLFENAEAAVREGTVPAAVLKIEDMQKIIDYGVMMTPALAIDGKIVSAGKVLSKEEIKKIISS